MTKDKPIKKFTDLIVWQEGHKLVLLIYKLTDNLPTKEKYSLIDQMRRAATSVTSNIAEGFGRRSYKEKIHFFHTAQGSLIELKNQLIISRDVGYISSSEYATTLKQANKTHALLQGILKKTKSFLNHKS